MALEIRKSQKYTHLRDEIVEKVNELASSKRGFRKKNQKNYKLTINNLRHQISNLNQRLSTDEEY